LQLPLFKHLKSRHQRQGSLKHESSYIKRRRGVRRRGGTSFEPLVALARSGADKQEVQAADSGTAITLCVIATVVITETLKSIFGCFPPCIACPWHELSVRAASAGIMSIR